MTARMMMLVLLLVCAGACLPDNGAAPITDTLGGEYVAPPGFVGDYCNDDLPCVEGLQCALGNDQFVAMHDGSGQCTCTAASPADQKKYPITEVAMFLTFTGGDLTKCLKL